MRYNIAGALSTIAVTFAFATCAHAASADHAASKPDVEAIRKLEEERNQAIIHGDAAALPNDVG